MPDAATGGLTDRLGDFAGSVHPPVITASLAEPEVLPPTMRDEIYLCIKQLRGEVWKEQQAIKARSAAR